MIISRTPFRISFFGGGTDYPEWFHENKGAVLATTIDKYCWITCRYLPPFFDHKSRIIYSKMEHVRNVSDINHPAVREVLKFMKIQEGVEIHHDGDLPARTGLGSSSSFSVGLLNALHALRGTMVSKDQLAKEAIFIEQEKCRECVGCQDQVLAAYGGLNYVEFGGTSHLRVTKVALPEESIANFQNHLLLFFTGFSRMASEIAKHQVKNIPKKRQDFSELCQMAKDGLRCLNAQDWIGIGKLLDAGWAIKRQLSKKITTPRIDEIYAVAKKAGALGGKLLGAGGGGFVLIFAEPEKQPIIRRKLKDLLEVPFRFEALGSQVIFYEPDSGKVQ